MSKNKTPKKEGRLYERKLWRHYLDYNFIAIILFLICFGLVMLYSTSYYSAQVKFTDDMYYFKRQALFSAVSFLIMLFVSRFDYHKFARFSMAFLVFTWILMLLVLSPLGISRYGARRWLRLPMGQQLEPSEIAKIAIVLFIPYLICKIGKQINTLKGVCAVLAWGLTTSAIIFLGTDHLSTAIIVFGIVYIMVFVVHKKSAGFVALAGGAAVLFIAGARFLAAEMESSGSFRLRRLLAWVNPEKYTDSGGYQIIQGLYAIGSGGFFGKGLGNSSQKLGFIPEVQNDMILAIICEELGVFGVILLLILFGMLLYRLIIIARNAPDLFGSLIAVGIFSHIALQVILNICVVLNLIPTTGITLPFISYGGTAIVFLMIEMGLALGISTRIRKEAELGDASVQIDTGGDR